MKTCKERNIFEEAKPAKEYPADWFVIPALDVGRYIKQNTVPLSEFEAYKQKTKQAINDRIVIGIDCSKPNDFFAGYNKALRDLKKDLEL